MWLCVSGKLDVSLSASVMFLGTVACSQWSSSSQALNTLKCSRYNVSIEININVLNRLIPYNRNVFLFYCSYTNIYVFPQNKKNSPENLVRVLEILDLFVS